MRSRFVFDLPKTLLLAGAAALVLAAAARELAVRAPGLLNGAGGAIPRWIWRDGDLRNIGPTAFFVARDFDLERVPARAAVTVVGDEEYVLFLNGAWIGGGAWRPRTPADRYDVTEWLRPGRNRWVAELRSSTGSGGFRLALADGEGRTLMVSDAAWRRFDGAWHGLFRDEPLVPAGPVRVLGSSPLGRWGSPRPGALRQALARLDPSRIRRAESVRFPAEDGTNQPLQGRRRGPSLGPLIEFDFGEEVSGYLQLAYRDAPGESRARPALVRFGDRPAPESPWPADEVVVPIAAAGNRIEAVPRAFRYVAVAGLPGVYAAEVLEVDPSEVAAPPRLGGLLGLESPRSGAPMQHEIWRELERFPGVVRGQIP